jgi:hypothetical protein
MVTPWDALSRCGLLALLLGLVVRWVAQLFLHERRLGHFAPLPPADEIDETWLAQHVLALKPELLGAAYDCSIDAEEFAALLARLEIEKKISSVARSKWGTGGRKASLDLTLLVDRATLQGYERALIDHLFFEGDRISTERIREKYSRSGFDPAAPLRAPLGEAVGEQLGASPRGRQLYRKPFRRDPRDYLRGTGFASVFVFIGLLPAVIEGKRNQVGEVLALAGFSAVGFLLAAQFRESVADDWRPARWLVGWIGVGVLAVLVLLITRELWASAFWVAVDLALVNAVLRRAKSVDDPTGIAFRKRIAAARRYFVAELARPEPALDDAWFPHLLALGLRPQIEQWRFSQDQHEQPSDTGSPRRWTGGGAFGAESRGPWTQAMAQLAAGVPRRRKTAARHSDDREKASS